jgi:hypothetical protein
MPLCWHVMGRCFRANSMTSLNPDDVEDLARALCYHGLTSSQTSTLSEKSL